MVSFECVPNGIRLRVITLPEILPPVILPFLSLPYTCYSLHEVLMTPDMGCERERRESRGLETPKAGPRLGEKEKEGRREGEVKEEGKMHDIK